MSPPRIGRPRVPKEEKRQVYPLRLSPKERAQYERAAAKAEQTLPRWMREVLTKAAGGN